MEGWNNFGPTPLPLTMFAPYNFNFWSKDQRYKKEGLDPNKGSTQLYVEISNKRSKVDFKVENIYIFDTNISEGTAFLLQGLTYSDKVKLRHTHSTLQVKSDHASHRM